MLMLLINITTYSSYYYCKAEITHEWRMKFESISYTYIVHKLYDNIQQSTIKLFKITCQSVINLQKLPEMCLSTNIGFTHNCVHGDSILLKTVKQLSLLLALVLQNERLGMGIWVASRKFPINFTSLYQPWPLCVRYEVNFVMLLTVLC
jgi:hypothetical protein